jgi:hypothetical protein
VHQAGRPRKGRLSAEDASRAEEVEEEEGANDRSERLAPNRRMVKEGLRQRGRTSVEMDGA